MFLLRGPGALCTYRRAGLFPSLSHRCLATKAYDPLRILFCGSDDFSIASLKALHEEHVKRPDRIASIDVVCRPGKKVGRGLKQIREGTYLGKLDKLFAQLIPPTLPGGPINLIIAVSFGLFVPPRLLNGAKYGAGKTKTGVTLQTLDLKHFDHGTILAQTPAPGFDIPNPDACTVPDLLNLVCPKGADILVKGIREGLFVPPVEDAGWRASEGDGPLVHAAKIKPEDRHIDWQNWSSLDISRRNRVLGPLWSKALVANNTSSEKPSFQHRRVIFTNLEEVTPLKGCNKFSVVPGLPFVDGTHPIDSTKGKGIYVFTRDGKLIKVHQMKVEGEPNADALRAALKARMVGDRTFYSVPNATSQSLLRKAPHYLYLKEKPESENVFKLRLFTTSLIGGNRAWIGQEPYHFLKGCLCRPPLNCLGREALALWFVHISSAATKLHYNCDGATYPFSQKKARKNRIHADLATLMIAYGKLLPVGVTAYLAGQHLRILPCDLRRGPTAMDEVSRNTPPSGFALNVGSAALKR
ncbi:methionyl-tRNA formyltransferase family protein [Aspergillus luchuensis]|uniref:Methionyl-tRNA formyltransferase family protein n=1 Tax=Aspergillus kawachii TaxID=1069201 RepID=A0A146F7E5_ASPKA|nr:methionyl-tRNA formyltransferase family protein [Aspergillus luchuensis]